MMDAVPLQTEMTSQSVDWVYDPNEPRYCLCNQVCLRRGGACIRNWFEVTY